MSIETRSQSSRVVVETSEETLETARSLADINLVLATVDCDDEAELKRKMECVQTSLADARDSLIADSGEWAGETTLKTERQQVTLDADIPQLLRDLLDVYFEEVGDLVFDDPDAKYDELCDDLGDLVAAR